MQVISFQAITAQRELLEDGMRLTEAVHIFRNDFEAVYEFVRDSCTAIGSIDDAFPDLFKYEIMPLITLLRPHSCVEWFLLRRPFHAEDYERFWRELAHRNQAYVAYVMEILADIEWRFFEKEDAICEMIRRLIFLVCRCIRRHDSVVTEKNRVFELFPQKYRNRQLRQSG